MTTQLDDVDKQLLDLLQENARYTATELATHVEVSDNTVHNRMARLEEAGVITGYTTTVEPAEVGLELTFHFTCTARISERADKADAVMSIPNVREVTELMTGQENLHITAVGATTDDISEVAQRLEELGVEVNDEILVRESHRKLLDYVTVMELVDDE